MTRTPGRTRRWLRALAAPMAATAALAVAAPAPAAPPGVPARAAADTAPPTAPGAIQIAEITETTIRLTWAASTDDVGVVSYEVNQAFTDVVLRRTTATNEILYNGLSRSRRYGFSVAALDAAGNRSPSVHLTVIMPPGDDQPPSAPGAPTATAVGDTTASLTWGPSTDNVVLQQYQVVRITPEGTTVVAIVWLQPPAAPTNSVQLRNLTPNTTYTFAVRATDEAGNVSANSPTVTVTTPQAQSCAVTYRIVTQWNGGFSAEVVLANSGPVAIDGWTLGWVFPADQRISHLWGAELVGDGGPAVEVRNLPWNGRIGPGSSVAFGFLGTWQGANPVPAGFVANGAPCGTAG